MEISGSLVLRTKPAYSIQVHSVGREVMRINRDGTIWFNPDLTPEEASREAFAALMRLVNNYNQSV